jgi:hypothetical protein
MDGPPPAPPKEGSISYQKKGLGYRELIGGLGRGQSRLILINDIRDFPSLYTFPHNHFNGTTSK